MNIYASDHKQRHINCPLLLIELIMFLLWERIIMCITESTLYRRYRNSDRAYRHKGLCCQQGSCCHRNRGWNHRYKRRHNRGCTWGGGRYSRDLWHQPRSQRPDSSQQHLCRDQLWEGSHHWGNNDRTI